MNCIGYGVMRDDKPIGIWPTSLAHAHDQQARYLKTALPGAVISVVPVFVGQPIAPAVDNEIKRFA